MVRTWQKKMMIWQKDKEKIWKILTILIISHDKSLSSTLVQKFAFVKLKITKIAIKPLYFTCSNGLFFNIIIRIMAFYKQIKVAFHDHKIFICDSSHNFGGKNVEVLAIICVHFCSHYVFFAGYLPYMPINYCFFA